MLHRHKVKIYELLYDAIKRSKLNIWSENYCNPEYVKGIATVINALGLSNDCMKYFYRKGYVKNKGGNGNKSLG